MQRVRAERRLLALQHKHRISRAHIKRVIESALDCARSRFVYYAAVVAPRKTAIDRVLRVFRCH